MKMFKSLLVVMFLMLVVGCSKTKTYTITFDTDGGTNVDSVVIEENEKLILPEEPTKEGYNFNGWLLNGNLFNESNSIDKNITLKADWITIDTKTYKVVFIYNNDTKDLEINVEENKKVSKPTNPTKEGYKFLGWYLDEQKFDFNTEINADIVLLAKWEKKAVVNNSNSNNNTSNNNNTTNNTSNSDVNKPSDTDKPEEVKSESAKVSYSCYDNSYKLSGTECIKTLTVNATKQYYCDNGYTLSGTTCSKQISTTDTKDATKEYYCSGNYTLSGTKCNYTHTLSPTTTYTCPSGYTQLGSQCKKETYSYSAVVMVCASGQADKSEKVIAEYCASMGLPRNKQACKSGYTLGDNTCYKLSTSTVSATPTTGCPSGYTFSNGQCNKYDSINALYRYECPSGYSNSGSKCIKTTYTTDKKPAGTKYTCSTGYTLSGTECQKKITVSANKEYTCPKNYTLKGTVCYSN